MTLSVGRELFRLGDGVFGICWVGEVEGWTLVGCYYWVIVEERGRKEGAGCGCHVDIDIARW
jgi:hypothetical protein